MSHVLRGKTVAVFLGICLFAWGGCASSKMARFYTLSPLSAPGEPSKTVPAEQGIAVAVGPVAIPDYLFRPQILTRSGPREFKLAEFERWAGSLEEDISRVLAENLSVLLSKDHVTVLRWGGDATLFPAEYRVGVDVMRFEGAIGESVILAAQWYVQREEDKKILSAHESNVREPVEGQDYDALVGAMSRALATLSREIAAAIPVN
ncbi:MAG: PqiC family protein [Candidatus Deferrimicrobiaceae bacterium]